MLFTHRARRALNLAFAIILLLVLHNGCSLGDPNQRPVKISGHKVATTEDGVLNTWNQIDDADAQISVFRREGTIGDGEMIASGLSGSRTSYLDTAGKSGAVYCYNLATSNKHGETTTGWSDPVFFPIGSPSTPAGLTAKALDSSTAFLEWEKVEPAVGYNIQRSASAVGPFATVSGYSPINAIAFLDSGLKSETEYFYRIQAVGISDKKSGFSDVVSVKTLSVEEEALADLTWGDINGDLTIVNTSYSDYVIFANSKLLGVAGKQKDTTFDTSAKFSDYHLGGAMIVSAIRLDNYLKNLANLSLAPVSYSNMAAYGQDKRYRMVLTNQAEGDFSFYVQNMLWNRGVELRYEKNGEKIIYLSPASAPVRIYTDTNERRTLVPVYIAYDTVNRCLVYLESKTWKETVEVLPVSGTPDVIYRFPPDNIDISFSSFTLPYSSVKVINNTGRLCVLRTGLTEYTAQSGYSGVESGKIDLFDVQGGDGEGTPVALNFALLTGSVSVPVRFEGSNELPSIVNGFIYEIVLTFIGNDVSNPDHYKAVIRKTGEVDTESLLIAF